MSMWNLDDNTDAIFQLQRMDHSVEKERMDDT